MRLLECDSRTDSVPARVCGGPTRTGGRFTRAAVRMMLALAAMLITNLALALPSQAADNGTFNYMVVNDTVTITACKDGSCPDTLSIPGTIDNKPVTTIGNLAFAYKQNLETVVIPNNVIEIGDSAFFGATGLKNLSIGASVKTIKDSAFRDASSLTKVVIPNSVLDIHASAFMNAANLHDLTLGTAVTAIGRQAFQNTRLKTVVIPDSVTTIGDDAFSGSNDLANVTIGAAVASIGNSAFDTTFTNLTVRFLGTALPPTFGSGAFRAAPPGPEPSTFYRVAGGTDWPFAISGHSLVEVAPPAITTQPQSAAVTSGANVTLNVAADTHTGGGSPSYQWSKDGAPINGATGASLNLSSVAANNAGSYTVSVSSWAGTTQSAAATVTVTPQDVSPQNVQRAKQAIKVKLPTSVKRNKKYSLPARTTSGVTIAWKLAKTKFCTLKKTSLRCTKTSGRKRITLTATAPGTEHLQPLVLTYTRKVK